MIPGEPTLEPEDMYDKWNNPNKPGKKNLKKNPWNELIGSNLLAIQSN